MKKFDLEKAKQGHPVVKYNGKEAIFLTDKNIDPYPLMFLVDDEIEKFTKEGGFEGPELFLADVDWQPPLKMGDKVLVENINEWEERIFVKEGFNESVICVDHGHRDRFYRGESFYTLIWEKWKRIDEPKEDPYAEIKKKMDLLTPEQWDQIIEVIEELKK